MGQKMWDSLGYVAGICIQFLVPLPPPSPVISSRIFKLKRMFPSWLVKWIFTFFYTFYHYAFYQVGNTRWLIDLVFLIIIIIIP